MKHIGILAGTFDPFHDGHMALARAALEQLELDEVWVLIEAYPRGKRGVTEFSHRLNMVDLAVGGEKRICSDAAPMQRQPAQFSLETARQLTGDFPDTEFTLIMGADVFAGIERWDGFGELKRLVGFAVAQRRGQQPADIAPRHLLITLPNLPVSSSSVRGSIREGRPEGIDRRLADYAIKNRLY